MKFSKFLYPAKITSRNRKMYTQYMKWTFVSNVVLSAQHVMGTHSMLNCMGLDSTGNVVSYNYIAKDIIGQFGSMVYVNTIGVKIDKEPEKIMVWSSNIQQLAIVMECATPLLPQSYFLPTAGIANFFKNVSWIPIGGVNAKIIAKVSDDNVGEVYSKLSISSTMASTLGLIIGLGVVWMIPEHEARLALTPMLYLLRDYSIKKSVQNIL